jgi:NTE family protein
MKKRKKIGLALGSGGFRGFAHIGVLKVLQENNIKIDYIAGTSIGSFIAAYYSLNLEIDSLLDKVESLGKRNIFQYMDKSSFGGLLSQNKISKHLEPIFFDYNFSDTKIPLEILATNLKNGKAKIFKRGSIKLAVQASCAVPLIFNPIRRNKELLVDGALCEPLPINNLYQRGADKVIAVNLYHKNEFNDKRFNLAHTALRAVRILLYNYSQEKAKTADININPDVSKQVIKAGLKTVFSKKLALEAIKVGEKSTKLYLNEIKKYYEV